MSSYDEHLISMAGGDGEPDLNAIQARREAYMRGDTSQQTIFEIVEDGRTLLALVRDQAAKLGRVEALAEEWRYKGEFGWGAWQEGHGPDPEGYALDHAAGQLRAAITATEASK